MFTTFRGIKIDSKFDNLLENKLHDKRSIILGYLFALLFSEQIDGEVYLIGSYARGDYDSGSDIDLMIKADFQNTQKIATIASKLEWTFEIPVQVVPMEDLDEISLDKILIYSSIQKAKNISYHLIIYRYLKNNRSKITVFNRHLKKMLNLYGGKKLAPKTFLAPLNFPLTTFLHKWKNLIKIQEKFMVSLGMETHTNEKYSR